jgi:hypothetical protein
MEWLNVWRTWSASAIAVGTGVVVGVTLMTVIAVLILEAQRRRDQSAAAFQDRLSEPILRELGQANVAILPTVRIPLWKAATRPAVIELTGQVPSADLRNRVVRLVEREAGRLRYFRIEDKIRVTPPAEHPGRRLA